MAKISRRSFLNLVGIAITGMSILPRFEFAKKVAPDKPSPDVGNIMYAGEHYWVYLDEGNWVKLPDEWLK